jgi:hypothetical protein
VASEEPAIVALSVSSEMDSSVFLFVILRFFEAAKDTALDTGLPLKHLGRPFEIVSSASFKSALNNLASIIGSDIPMP